MYVPFKVICSNIYKVGDIAFCHDESVLFIIQDLLTSFTIIEELTELKSASFICVAMNVILQLGLCHTFIVDAASKFKSFSNTVYWF